MGIPREHIQDRDGLERAVDGVERNFMLARDRVKACPTFRKLVPGDQRRIAAVLFELFPPTE